MIFTNINKYFIFRTLTFFFLTLSVCSYSQTKEKKYCILVDVKKTIPGHKSRSVCEVNKTDVDKLSEPLKALATYYSVYSGSNCELNGSGKETCELTTALQLGDQGSDEQKNILKKWFPDNAVVTEMIRQNCFLSVPGSSGFNNYRYLNFIRSHDTVYIDYQINHFSQGKSEVMKGNDVAIIKKDAIIFAKK